MLGLGVLGSRSITPLFVRQLFVESIFTPSFEALRIVGQTPISFPNFVGFLRDVLRLALGWLPRLEAAYLRFAIVSTRQKE